LDELDDYDADAPDEEGISGLLESAFALSIAFQEWSRSVCKLDEKLIRQDATNAESMLDYLANYHRKPFVKANEFEVRWFIFSHYIRKNSEDPETEERLLSSLRRFLSFMEDTTDYLVPDWFTAALDDVPFYQRRRAQYHGLNSEDEKEWRTGFEMWCEELNTDLDARCLLLPDTIGSGLFWSKEMGWREATLQAEANMLWQEQREELIADGFAFEQMREHLQISYLEWLDTPQDKLDGQSPFDVIQAEQLDAAEDSDQDTDDENAAGDALWP
jgi:hypothetical protein